MPGQKQRPMLLIPPPMLKRHCPWNLSGWKTSSHWRRTAASFVQPTHDTLPNPPSVAESARWRAGWEWSYSPGHRKARRLRKQESSSCPVCGKRWPGSIAYARRPGRSPARPRGYCNSPPRIRCPSPSSPGGSEARKGARRSRQSACIPTAWPVASRCWGMARYSSCCAIVTPRYHRCCRRTSMSARRSATTC